MAVYKLQDKEGKTRYVDAKTANAAVQHVYKPEVTPLKASEVARIAREGAVIEEAA